MQHLLHWPGKAHHGIGGAVHPAAYHMLDVAAVAEALILQTRHSAAIREAIVYLCALHDVGKISESFSAYIRDPTGPPQIFKHWELSEFILYENDDLLSGILGGSQKIRQQLYSAVSGHHGRPSILDIQTTTKSMNVDRSQACALIGAGAQVARDLLSSFASFWPRGSLSELSLRGAKALSWWLPGFCATADWIGSNIKWFPPEPADLTLEAYLAKARAKALVAVDQSGLSGSSPHPAYIARPQLRPLQSAVINAPIEEGPSLTIIEDQPGSGKTDAALILAHRLMLAGKGRGIFYALPSMATADSMFLRISPEIGKILASPTLTLAHGRAKLSVPFKEIIRSPSMSIADTADCTEWLAQSRHRTLLADVGIGTVDQALMAILPIKHQSMRLYGLSSKILIVDEVHEMGEPYVADLLVELLCAHRALGGSAILATATLPTALKLKLLDTYGGKDSGYEYPAISITAKEQTTKIAVEPTGIAKRIGIRRIAEAAQAIAAIAEASKAGATCCWVRNSVDDAIEAYLALKGAGTDAILIHSRFTMGDRKRIERAIDTSINGTAHQRAGTVVIGTQILESSLDLDFDVMVSDIAPIAAIIQRSGRLWRHMDLRPAECRPVPQPILYLLSPDPYCVDSSSWLQGTLNGGAWVYPISDTWRSAKVLIDTGQIVAPDDIRRLIEAGYDEFTEPAPSELVPAQTSIHDSRLRHSALATQNAIQFDRGYRSWGGAGSDRQYPTRLGPGRINITLCIKIDGQLAPLNGGNEVADWELSEVPVGRWLAKRAPALLNLQETTIRTGGSEEAYYTGKLVCIGESELYSKILKYNKDLGLLIT